jgi:hypothetical protein
MKHFLFYIFLFFSNAIIANTSYIPSAIEIARMGLKQNIVSVPSKNRNDAICS